MYNTCKFTWLEGSNRWMGGGQPIAMLSLCFEVHCSSSIVFMHKEAKKGLIYTFVAASSSNIITLIIIYMYTYVVMITKSSSGGHINYYDYYYYYFINDDETPHLLSIAYISIK